jgi:hypothetical protein
MAKSNKMGAAPEQPELNSQEAFFLKYRKQIIAAVVAVIVVIAGCIVYNTFIAGPREEKASTALAKAQDLFAQGEYQKALTGDNQTEGLVC